MVRSMNLFVLPAMASVAVAFAPSAAFVPSAAFAPSASWSQIAPSSSRLHETVSPVESTSINPYKTHTLEEVLNEAASKFHAIVKHGIPAKKIPPLDPFNIGTISLPLKNNKVDVTLTLNDAVIKGLDTISLTSKPVVDFKELSVGISFNIKELQLYTEDYDREGSFTLLFKKDISKYDRELTVTLSDVDLKLTLDLDFTDLYKPVLNVVPDASKLEIGNIKTDLKDSFFYHLIEPFLKNYIVSAISSNVKGIMETHLTEKLQEVAVAQKQWVDDFNRIYKLRAKTDLLVDAEGNELKPVFLEGLEGVGQFAIPMFWEVVKPPKDKMEHISMEKIIETGKTGDLILCSGTVPAAKLIRRWTQSPFSHVIMIVKEPELCDGKTVMIQATSSEHLNLLTNKRVTGLQINDIKTFMVEFKEEFVTGNDDPSCLVFRSLTSEKGSEEDKKKSSKALIDFIKETDSIPYSEDWGMIPLFILGLTGAELEEKNDGKTFYCASYVAEAMIKWGLIEDTFLSQQYSPRDFSQKYDTLPFVDSATSFGPEKLVDIS